MHQTLPRTREFENGRAVFEHSRRFFFGNFTIAVVKFYDELPYFSEMKWITHFQIPHGVLQNAYLSKDTKLEVYLRFMLLGVSIKPQKSN
jgi:hypothetical protein